MATATDLLAGLAHDIEGTGTPAVFLHGLAFDRRTWRPVTDQLDGSVTSIAVDLPAHGDSGGEPTSLEAVAEQIHLLPGTLDVERPVVVGHSMAAGLAGLYASAHPARGVVLVDQATEVLPFAQMLDTHKVRQDVVLGYWDQVLTTEPAELQAWIDDSAKSFRGLCEV